MSSTSDLSQIPDTTVLPVRPQPVRPSSWASIWTFFRQHPSALVGLCILLVFVLLGLLAPWIAPYSPETMSAQTSAPPSLQHWLGTTGQGQDVLSQLLWGARSSLVVGGASGFLATLIAVLVGVGGTYIGGVVENLAVSLTNVFLVMPGLPLIIVLAAYLPREGSLAIIGVIGLTGWGWAARVLRSQALVLRQREFVLAARMSGESRVGVVFRDILPNMLSLASVMFLSHTIYAIIAAASLQFLGLGGAASTVSWGSMLYWAGNDQAVLGGAWWQFVPPGLCIALVGLSLALLSQSIDELTNRQLRVSRSA